MATFTVSAKIYSIEYFCNTKAARLAKYLFSKNFQLYMQCLNLQPAEQLQTPAATRSTLKFENTIVVSAV